MGAMRYKLYYRASLSPPHCHCLIVATPHCYHLVMVNTVDLNGVCKRDWTLFGQLCSVLPISFWDGRSTLWMHQLKNVSMLMMVICPLLEKNIMQISRVEYTNRSFSQRERITHAIPCNCVIGTFRVLLSWGGGGRFKKYKEHLNSLLTY